MLTGALCNELNKFWKNSSIIVLTNPLTVDQIIEHFRQNGFLEKEILAEQPFTYIHHDGIFGVFEKETDQARIISIVDGVNANAEVG